MEKSGFKTTEFWLSFLVVLLGAYMASGLVGDEHWTVKLAGLVASALASLGYGMARAAIKASSNKQ